MGLYVRPRGTLWFSSPLARRRRRKRQLREAAEAAQAYTASLRNGPPRPSTPPGCHAALWNGTVWHAWDERQRRWLVWDGYAWR